MNERPIIFSAPMVRAILEDRKTQTRRVVKLPSAPMHLGTWEPFMAGGYLDKACTMKAQEMLTLSHTRTGQCVACPYGVPGDQLWVRETLRTHEHFGFPLGECPQIKPLQGRVWSYAADNLPDHTGSRPSIHMPRWASRITLEVVNVRVERLQDISSKDIIAEGAVDRPHVDQFGMNPVSAFDGKVYLDLRSLWAAGWDSINDSRAPWSSNPWVWVLEFKRCP